ncbi:MAG: aspartate-semialdehyde dehydrogenase [Enterobacteriaceae bacterium]
MKKVGLIGWRGIVGTALLKRMEEKKDFIKFNSFFFSRSYVNKNYFISKYGNSITYNSLNISHLNDMDIIINCSGSKYSKKMYKNVRLSGWDGYWIDTSSYLRMKNNVILALYPINYKSILFGLKNGIKTYSIANCTVNIILMSLKYFFFEELLDWIILSTYQSVSGGGTNYFQNFLSHVKYISKIIKKNENILDIEEKISNNINNLSTNKHNFSILGNLLPWIGDKKVCYKTEEEFKNESEINKILNFKKKIIVESTCVRVPSLRCHANSCTLKLNKYVHIKEIEKKIKLNKWIKLIPNDRLHTIKYLYPSKISGSLKLFIGRLRKLKLGEKYLSLFVIGDQLLWGTVEPLRKMLNELLNHLN